MALAPQLLAAYRNAEYVVFGEPQIVLRIGAANGALDALLQAHGAPGAAFISAANPRGRRIPERANRAAQLALAGAVRQAGFACYPGEGHDPSGAWRAEPSLLVLGIMRAQAAELGRRFGQNAIVYARRGGAPELVLLA